MRPCRASREFAAIVRGKYDSKWVLSLTIPDAGFAALRLLIRPRRDGEIGRRSGLKIRGPERVVGVRVPLSAPFNLLQAGVRPRSRKINSDSTRFSGSASLGDTWTRRSSKGARANSRLAACREFVVPVPRLAATGAECHRQQSANPSLASLGTAATATGVRSPVRELWSCLQSPLSSSQWSTSSPCGHG